MVNPIPKTSNGEKLRLNSACVVGHVRSRPVKNNGQTLLVPEGGQ